MLTDLKTSLIRLFYESYIPSEAGPREHLSENLTDTVQRIIRNFGLKIFISTTYSFSTDYNTVKIIGTKDALSSRGLAMETLSILLPEHSRSQFHKIMNIKNMSKTTLLVLAFGVATMASSQAAYINGEIRFGGLGTLDSPATTATAINFLGALTIAVSGDYSPIPVLDVIPPTLSVGTPVTFTDFVFGAPGTVGPNAQSPLWTLSFGGDTYSFDLTAITINSVVGTQRNIEGTGVAKITGFDDTPGHWSLSTSGESTTISFSSSTTAAAPVPDGGTSVALLGGSLLGLAGLRRKFLRN